MNNLSNAITEDNTWLSYCEKLGHQLKANRITFVEYANGITIGVISAPDDQLEMCVDRIALDVLPQYLDFLKALLLPCDFLPSAIAYYVGSSSDGQYATIQAQLRPKYVHLYQAVSNRLG